ncbi:TIGR02452 family protein [bacterium]|nr:TIGR02452 family protein [bacterium]
MPDYSERTERLINIFNDTQARYNDNPDLAAAVKKSCREAKLYEADEYPTLTDDLRKPQCEVTITKLKTFEAAMRQRQLHPQAKIAVLNFASATNPGGGVKKGSIAQEECLCRCSTLYPTLDTQTFWQKYYNVNRASCDAKHTDACIYSPNIVVFKSDEQFPAMLKPQDWVTLDVITCAAPNLRSNPNNRFNPGQAQKISLTPDQQYKLHLQRARHILTVAASHNADILILGAFGCGAFRNDPYAVARAYRDALGELHKYFSRVEFAIYCRDNETINFNAFRQVLTGKR